MWHRKNSARRIHHVGPRRSGGPMDEQQAPPESDGKAPHAAGKPGGSEDEGYELPPPPAPGALWGDAAEAARPSSAPPSQSAGRATVPGVPTRMPDSLGGSTRPISATPGANAARASVPGAVTPDPALLRAAHWPSGPSKIYGGRADTTPEPEPQPEPDPEPQPE